VEPVGDPLRHLGVELLVILVPLPQVQRQLPQLREGQAPPVPAVEIRCPPAAGNCGSRRPASTGPLTPPTSAGPRAPWSGTPRRASGRHVGIAL